MEGLSLKFEQTRWTTVAERSTWLAGVAYTIPYQESFPELGFRTSSPHSATHLLAV